MSFPGDDVIRKLRCAAATAIHPGIRSSPTGSTARRSSSSRCASPSCSFSSSSRWGRRAGRRCDGSASDSSRRARGIPCRDSSAPRRRSSARWSRRSSRSSSPRRSRSASRSSSRSSRRRWLRQPVAFLIDLLAADPERRVRPVGRLRPAPAAAHARSCRSCATRCTSARLPFFSGPAYGPSVLAAGLILAIMILPYIASVSREVLLAVPRSQREAALALGATRWETITGAVRAVSRGRASSAGSSSGSGARSARRWPSRW